MNNHNMYNVHINYEWREPHDLSMNKLLWVCGLQILLLLWALNITVASIYVFQIIFVFDEENVSFMVGNLRRLNLQERDTLGRLNVVCHRSPVKYKS
jgi:hypothetical protein